jgi:hypothetical protein
MSNNIYNIMRSSREATPIQKLKTISTEVEDPRNVELLVSLYLPHLRRMVTILRKTISR